MNLTLNPRWNSGVSMLALFMTLVMSTLTTAAAQALISSDWKSYDAEAMRLLGFRNYDAALVAGRTALELAEKAFGGSGPEVWTALDHLARIYWPKGDIREAERLYERALTVSEATFGLEHIKTAESLVNLASLYSAKGEDSRAEPLLQRAVAITERAFGSEHPRTAVAMDRLAFLYFGKGDYPRAEVLYQSALAIRERAFVLADLSTAYALARSLANLGFLYRSQGDYEKAESLCLRALAILESALGPEHRDLAKSVDDLAAVYKVKQDYDRAESLYQRALAIRYKTLSPDDPDISRSVENLAALYRAKGDWAQAESLYRRALAMSEQAYGPEHPKVADALDKLAYFYYAKGDRARMVPLRERQLAIRQKAFGPTSRQIMFPLIGLANAYLDEYDYPRAESLYQRALAIGEKELGSEHPNVASLLVNIAAVDLSKGDFVHAESLLRRALVIQERVYGTHSPNIVNTLDWLQAVYEKTHDYVRATQFAQRALAVNEEGLGVANRDTAISLVRLGNLYVAQGNYSDAERLYLRALAIDETLFGPDSTSRAGVMNNLAALYSDMHDYSRAEPLYQLSLTMTEKAFGSEHPNVAGSLSALASFYARQGNDDRAEPFLRRAVAIYESSFGAEHPQTSRSLVVLARLYLRRGDYARALPLLARNLRIEERTLIRGLATGSQSQKETFLSTFATSTEERISLALRAPEQHEYTRMAFTAVAQRKSRVLDVVSHEMTAVRRQLAAEDQNTLAELFETRARLAHLSTVDVASRNADDHATKWHELTEKEERLQSILSARSAEFLTEERLPTFDSLAAQLPPNTALVEFYRRANAQFLAFVLRSGGGLSVVDLGTASTIDNLSRQLTLSLSSPANAGQSRQIARRLDSLVMQPVRAVLGDQTDGLLVAPDGELNLVPFAALIDEHQHYLVERFQITYLSSGLDLLRLQETTESRQAASIIGSPTFGPPSASGCHFEPLIGSMEEADAVAARIPNAMKLLEESATADALRRLSGPRILHVATHGFFDTEGTCISKTASPMLRSGLALAGANNRDLPSGIMTALEIADLDLRGTQLTVLSSCETGVGEVHRGEGVFGLRRALVIAGSRSQVLSLWRVDDDNTRDLMVAYYDQLMAGVGRSAALRAVQLRMLQDGRDPSYWAAFIPSGDWTPLGK